jgi:hypothetical protein
MTRRIPRALSGVLIVLALSGPTADSALLKKPASDTGRPRQSIDLASAAVGRRHLAFDPRAAIDA